MSFKYQLGQVLVNKQTGTEHKIIGTQNMMAPYAAEYTLRSQGGRRSKKLEGDIDALYSAKAIE